MHRRVQITSCTGLENEERRNSGRVSAHAPWSDQHGQSVMGCQLICIGECRQRVARASKTSSDGILSECQRMSRGATSTGGAVCGVSYDASESADNELHGPRKRGATEFWPSVSACPVVRPARAVRYGVSANMHRRVQTTSCTGLENEERWNSERVSAHVPWCDQHGQRGMWCQLRCIGECRQRVARAS